VKTFETIASEAMELPLRDRLSLAHVMLNSVDGASEPDAEAAWEKEIQERIRAYDSGEVQPVSGPKVMQELKQKLAR
jgi:putative addiction module component (TIGR02574 family)